MIRVVVFCPRYKTRDLETNILVVYKESFGRAGSMEVNQMFTDGRARKTARRREARGDCVTTQRTYPSQYKTNDTYMRLHQLDPQEQM